MDRNVEVVYQALAPRFEEECNRLIKDGYIVSSTSCSVIDKYESRFIAILIKQEKP